MARRARNNVPPHRPVHRKVFLSRLRSGTVGKKTPLEILSTAACERAWIPYLLTECSRSFESVSRIWKRGPFQFLPWPARRHARSNEHRARGIGDFLEPTPGRQRPPSISRRRPWSQLSAASASGSPRKGALSKTARRSTGNPPIELLGCVIVRQVHQETIGIAAGEFGHRSIGGGQFRAKCRISRLDRQLERIFSLTPSSALRFTSFGSALTKCRAFPKRVALLLPRARRR